MKEKPEVKENLHIASAIIVAWESRIMTIALPATFWLYAIELIKQGRLCNKEDVN